MTAIMSPELRRKLEVLKTSAFEKNIPYMYIDTTGNVTVGVGHNITGHNDLPALKFKVKRLVRRKVKGGDIGISITGSNVLDRPATDTEKQSDYDFLMKHSALGTYPVENLAKYTTLEMDPSDIDKLFDLDLKAAFNITVTEFHAVFDKLSINRQAALIDIAFNAGGFGSFRGHFVPAVKSEGKYSKMSDSERWTEAGKNARRGQVGPERNRQVIAWLTDES